MNHFRVYNTSKFPKVFHKYEIQERYYLFFWRKYTKDFPMINGKNLKSSAKEVLFCKNGLKDLEVILYIHIY